MGKVKGFVGGDLKNVGVRGRELRHGVDDFISGMRKMLRESGEDQRQDIRVGVENCVE